MFFQTLLLHTYLVQIKFHLTLPQPVSIILTPPFSANCIKWNFEILRYSTYVVVNGHFSRFVLLCKWRWKGYVKCHLSLCGILSNCSSSLKNLMSYKYIIKIVYSDWWLVMTAKYQTELMFRFWNSVLVWYQSSVTPVWAVNFISLKWNCTSLLYSKIHPKRRTYPTVAVFTMEGNKFCTTLMLCQRLHLLFLIYQNRKHQVVTHVNIQTFTQFCLFPFQSCNRIIL